MARRLRLADPAGLPGAARLMVLRRTEAEVLSGMEFLIGTEWMARPDIHKMQAHWGRISIVVPVAR